MGKNKVYLDTYILQQDMRVHLPKSVLSNLQIEKGKTYFDIYLDSDNKSLICKVHEDGNER